MNDDLEVLLKKIQLAQSSLDEAAEMISRIPLEPRRDNIILIGNALAEISTIERKIYQLRPELEILDDIEPDVEMTREDLDFLAENLSAQDLELIDNFILKHCSREFRKVARIVGESILRFTEDFPDVGPAFYFYRIKMLISKGLLESQGNLMYMRFSEIRLV